MKNRTILPLILLILLIISISAISASDVTNGTDTLSSLDDSNQISTIDEDTSTLVEGNIPEATDVEVDGSGMDSPSIVSTDVGELSCSTSLDEGVIISAPEMEVKTEGTVQIVDLPKGSYSLEVSNPTIVNKKTLSMPNMAAGSSKNTFAVYLFGVNMNSVDLAKLKNNHIGNIFLNFYAYETYGKSKVESFIKKANSYGIQVHIWMQVYYDGQWHNPATASSSYINSKINEAVKYAKLAGVAGVHLDYLRFAGSGSFRASKYSSGVKAINSLVQKIVTRVKAVDKNILVSAALMPEKGDAITYYGQNSAQLGKYLDIVVPMAYKGNYGVSSSWIKSTAQYYAKHSGTAQVWIALQSYRSDSDTTKLSASALKTDAQNAISGGANGVVFFRYALSNLFDVSSISGVKAKSTAVSTSTSSVKLTLSQILNAASTVRSYYSKNKKLPKTVTIGSTKCTMAQFLYYEALAISNLNSGKKSSISKIRSLKEPSSPNSGDSFSNKKLSKAGYVDSAKRTYKWIKDNGQGPNYSTTTIGRVNYNNLVEGFSAVLTYYKSYKKLPSYVTITYKKSATLPSSSSSSTKKTSTKTASKTSTSTASSGAVKSVTFNQILNAANTVRTYYAKNKKLPKTVKIGSLKCTMAQFLYYEARAISNLNSGKKSSISKVKSLGEPSSPNSGNSISNRKLSKSQYVDSAKRTYKWILENGQGPNYSTTNIGRLNYNNLVEGFSAVLTYYKSYKTLPSYITVTNKKSAVWPSKSSSKTSSKSFSISQIVNAAGNVKKYYAKNGELPGSVMIGSYRVSITRFLYYESLAIVRINNKNLARIPFMTKVLSGPSNPYMGDSIKNKRLKKAGYVDSAKRTYKFIAENRQGPNYSTTTVGKVNFNALTDAFSRILVYYGNHKELPDSCVITTASQSGDTSSISALAKSLTKGLTSTRSKAVRLFNWVRDYVSYDYYYNSQQGAAKTLKVRSGNCCDQSNLYVAMCRAVGITVRYVHGTCHFSDGWYGHVWTEVKLGGRWYSADPVSVRNTFGTINNWNTNTATIHARYTNLPF